MKVKPSVILAGLVGGALVGLFAMAVATSKLMEKAATTPATAFIVEKEGFKCIAIHYKERLATDCVYEPVTETTP